jgi:hypothetical protein
MRWLAIILISLAAGAAAAQDAKTRADVTVSLERGTCERRCPVYRVTLHGDGRLTYEGRHHVRKAGTVQARVPPAEVRRLLQDFEALDFFALRDIYGGEPGDCRELREDAPRSALTLSRGGQSKTVRHNVGCIGPVTSRLTELGEAIDRLADTKRWTR